MYTKDDDMWETFTINKKFAYYANFCIETYQMKIKEKSQIIFAKVLKNRMLSIQ